MSQSIASLISTSQVHACSYAAVNAVLGGGLPSGHILEISGPPGSFKETLALDYTRLFVEANKEVMFVGNFCFRLTCRSVFSEIWSADTQNITSLATIKKTFRSELHSIISRVNSKSDNVQL